MFIHQKIQGVILEIVLQKGWSVLFLQEIHHIQVEFEMNHFLSIPRKLKFFLINVKRYWRPKQNCSETKWLVCNVHCQKYTCPSRDTWGKNTVVIYDSACVYLLPLEETSYILHHIIPTFRVTVQWSPPQWRSHALWAEDIKCKWASLFTSLCLIYSCSTNPVY